MTAKRDAVKTRKTVLAVAESLFARQGYAATSMRDIAAGAEVKAATLYHYFPSKEELLNEIFGDFYSELAELYARVESTMPPDGSVREGLVYFMRHHRDFMARRRDGAYLFFLEALRPGSPAAARLKTITAESGKNLKRITRRWESLAAAEAVTLLAAVIAIDVFMEVAAPYLKDVMGARVPGETQLKLIENLLNGSAL